MSIVNIAAYRFVALDDVAALREAMLAAATSAALRGTVLLAPEGINLFLAGEASAIQGFVAWLDADPRFRGMEVKYSESGNIPFRKLLVKIKREIIRMDHPAIRPEAGRARAVDARTLRRWLAQRRDDAGREVVLLDTRNAFEVDHGTFDEAIDYRISRFTQFPQAVVEHRDDLQGKTVVTFCTGGIRCEKAAIFMRDAGIDNVYQLDGGILKYFEQTDGTGFHGECFVFDERVALDAGLAPKPAEGGV